MTARQSLYHTGSGIKSKNLFLDLANYRCDGYDYNDHGRRSPWGHFHRTCVSVHAGRILSTADGFPVFSAPQRIREGNKEILTRTEAIGMPLKIIRNDITKVEAFGGLKSGATVSEGEALFSRLDEKETLEKIGKI